MSNNARRRRIEKVVKNRLLWVLKPLLFTMIAVWAFHPDTVSPNHVEQNLTVGFLLGAFYSAYLRREALLYYLSLRRLGQFNRKNRVPAEFCLGRTMGVVVAQGESSAGQSLASAAAAAPAAEIPPLPDQEKPEESKEK